MKRAATLVVALILALAIAPSISWAASGGMRAILRTGSSWNYTVKPGDTLYSLAKRFGQSISSIQKASGLKTSRLLVGQVLTIPGTGGSSRGTGSTRSTLAGQQSQEDLYWLAKIIYAESRGEPFQGQVAVGAVIINRLQNPRFPKTIKSIIFEKWGGYYQFSPVADGAIWQEPNSTAYAAAREALSGVDPSKGALYFYEPSRSTSQWIFSRPVITKIGNHVFTG